MNGLDEEISGGGATNIADYTFNALGNKVMKFVNAGAATTKMLYDGADCVADYDNDLELQRYYITPMLDENLLLNNGSADYYYTHDGLGTVRDILDSSQNTENNYDFYAYGTSKASTENITNRFKFTGRELDTETESANSPALYYYRARAYDSEAGSFTGRDPLGEIGSFNLYTYVASNPTNNTDPFGLWIYTEEFINKVCGLSKEDFELLELGCNSSGRSELFEHILEAMRTYCPEVLKIVGERHYNYIPIPKVNLPTSPLKIGLMYGSDMVAESQETSTKDTRCERITLNWNLKTYSYFGGFHNLAWSHLNASLENNNYGCVDELTIYVDEKDVDISQMKKDLDENSFCNAVGYITSIAWCPGCTIWIASCKFAKHDVGDITYRQLLANLTGCKVIASADKLYIDMDTGEFRHIDEKDYIEKYAKRDPNKWKVTEPNK